MHEGVDFQHEGMKMHPAFLFHRGSIEEKIHQHGFSAPGIAIDIESLRRFHARLAGTQTENLGPAGAGLWIIVNQATVQGLQLLDREPLSRIILNLLVCQQLAIGFLGAG